MNRTPSLRKRKVILGKHGDFELKEVVLKYPTPKLYEMMKEIQGITYET